MTSDMSKYGRKVLADQPFSVLLGAELLRLETGTAELALELQEKHKQQHGFAHGGVVSYVADNALTLAGGSVLGDSVTLEFKINYVRPAIGARLVAKANLLSSGKTTAVCRCDVFIVKDGEEKLCATAQGTIQKIAT